MPDPVAHGVPRKVAACGFCHLPDGQGRSENGALAGLSADYIVEQVKDFRSRKRREAIPRWGFQTTMENIADSVSDHDLEIAAKYFASIRPKPRVKVLERNEIQRSYQANGLSALHPDGGLEPLGDRIVEITEDIERHDLRDPRTGFIAYVPIGSIERGRKIAHATGRDAARACVTCHGENLLGKGPAPLIAGRSPAYIVRQLIGLQDPHTRRTVEWTDANGNRADVGGRHDRRRRVCGVSYPEVTVLRCAQDDGYRSIVSDDFPSDPYFSNQLRKYN